MPVCFACESKKTTASTVERVSFYHSAVYGRVLFLNCYTHFAGTTTAGPSEIIKYGPSLSALLFLSLFFFASLSLSLAIVQSSVFSPPSRTNSLPLTRRVDFGWRRQWLGAQPLRVIIVGPCIMIEGRKNGSARGMLEEKTATENKREERKNVERPCHYMRVSIRKTMRMDQHPEAEAYK